MAKKLSRRKRCDAAVNALRTTAENARDIAESIRAEENPTLEFINTLRTRVDALGIETDELECLKDEIAEWRDNMPESLQGGEKYSILDDTANCLEGVVDELQGLEVPAFPGPERKLGEILPWLQGELPDLLDELADSIEAQCDEADNAEFPGMMG